MTYALYILVLAVLLLDWNVCLAQEKQNMNRNLSFDVPEKNVGAPYSVTVNGRAIPVELGTRIQKTYYARFRMQESAEIRVEHYAESDASCSLRPYWDKTDAEVDGNAITFSVSDTKPRIIQVEGLPYLFIFPEPLQDEPIDKDNLIAIDPDGESVIQHTQRIQSAIDRLSNAGGGTVYLKAGVHRSKVIHLKSHVTLHLAGGAVLIGTGDPTDYEASHGRRALILIDHAMGASIKGQGIIDGAGSILQPKYEIKAHLIDALGCRDLAIDDVILRDPGAWTLHLIDCEDVTISRIKILGDWKLSNTDGIDPDMSRRVTISNCFIYSGDDAIAVKATRGLGVETESHTITAKDCVIMTRKTACKIGTESRLDIRNVLFENIEIVDSSRGCALWMRDGATYSNITFRNIRMNLMLLPDERWSGEAFRVSIQERDGLGRMEGVLFEDITAESPKVSLVRSRIDRPVSGVIFKNCVWSGEAMDEIPGVEVNNAKDISFVDCVVEVGTVRQPFTDQFIVGTSKDAVQIR